MVTTKSRYALRAMVTLALRQGDGPVSVEDIAREEGVSEKYLGTVMGMLKAAGLVTSQRGPHGGYSLRRTPESITAYDVVAALDGTLAGIPCVDAPGTCSNEDACETRHVWRAVSQASKTQLRRFSLADLIGRSVSAESRGA